ncbi:MAG: response regulator [Archangiaceae bacterium]|nr:response regulator [Archangiaceae bacterium]
MAEARPFRLLLVEDEPVIRELVRSMLGDGTVDVECAATGAEGLKLAKTNSYDLILLDVVLPQMDGITICRLLKADPKTAATPLYMLTAKAKKTDVETAIKAGADGYIHKPFRVTELMELIERLRPKA